MHEKELPPPLDAALSQVDTERRRLLGILLAGAAALPLLNSTTLGAQEKTAAQSRNNTRVANVKHGPLDFKTDSGTIKSNSQIKGDRTIKMDSHIKSKTASKNATWIKGGATANDSSQIKAASSQSKTGATIKSTATIKSSTGAMKTDNMHIKSNATPQH